MGLFFFIKIYVYFVSILISYAYAQKYPSFYYLLFYTDYFIL